MSPDPTVAPVGRIEGGATLEEIGRVGDWVEVRTDGDVWWVDGRRLRALVDDAVDEFPAAPSVAADVVVSDAVVPAAARPHDRSGLPRPLLAIAALGIGLVLVGATSLVLTDSTDDGDPWRSSVTDPSAEPTPTVADVVPTREPAPETTEPPRSTPDATSALTTTSETDSTDVPDTTNAPATTRDPSDFTSVAIQLGETFEPTVGLRPPRLEGLAIGPSGVWTVRPGTGVLYRVDPATDAISLTVPVDGGGGLRSGPVLVTGHGSVWVTALVLGHVARVDESSGEVTGRIEVGTGIDDIEVTSDAIWLLATGSDGVEIARIDPATDRETARFRVTDGAASGGTIVAADGALWVGYWWGPDGWVLRVDPATGAVTATVEVSCLRSVVAHRGAILAVDSCPGGGGLHLVEIDPATGAVADQHRVTAVGPIASDGEVLAMATPALSTETLAWWAGAVAEAPETSSLAALLDPDDDVAVTDVAVDGDSIWLATEGSARLLHLDGLWRTSS